MKDGLFGYFYDSSYTKLDLTFVVLSAFVTIQCCQCARSSMKLNGQSNAKRQPKQAGTTYCATARLISSLPRILLTPIGESLFSSGILRTFMQFRSYLSLMRGSCFRGRKRLAALTGNHR